MEVSEFLRARLVDGLTMLDYEAKQLKVARINEKALMPYELLQCNGVGLIKSVMHIVLFEKNYNELAFHYKELSKRFLESFPDFDDLEINYIQIQGMAFAGPINTPTLKTPYGELVLGLPDSFVAEFYRNLKATIVPGNDSDNVVKVDFGGKKN